MLCNVSSIKKHSGDLISSKFIPPNDGPNYLTLLMNSCGSCVSMQMSMESTYENFLNKTDLPSMTGLDALAPRLPSPRIAVPLDITATVLPLLV